MQIYNILNNLVKKLLEIIKNLSSEDLSLVEEGKFKITISFEKEKKQEVIELSDDPVVNDLVKYLDNTTDKIQATAKLEKYKVKQLYAVVSKLNLSISNNLNKKDLINEIIWHSILYKNSIFGNKD
ncbi:MAG: hypothetical protein LBR11_08365 [Deltaproteobacteria bacterium]|jgi:hypothetical protein|nr:hypothetical protein [Deltaproteobacteria bacterium]